MADADLGIENGILYIAAAEGLKRVMGNQKLFVRLLTKFRDETKLDGLLGAIKANDMEKARVEAHTLKGIAANLSLQELFLKTQELEAQIKAGSADNKEAELLVGVFAGTLRVIDKVIGHYGNV